MSRAARATTTVVTVLLLGGAAYATADAYDMAPGLITLEPVPVPPAPFPTAPAAVPAPPVEPVLAHLDPDAPLPDAAALEAAARAAVAHPWMGDSTGVVVTDVLTGEVLVDLAGSTPQEPASTAKLLTALAALTALGADTTLPTTVVQGAPGSLTLVGGGDVMLAAGRGDAAATNGRAGLADLADQVTRALKLAGSTEVTLRVDDRLVSGPALSPGWDESYMREGFVAPVSSLAVNLAKTRDEPYPPRHDDPALHTAKVLAGLLEDEGITVTGVAHGEAPGDGRTLGTVESAPVREVVRYALHTSDNTLTEVLGRLVAVDRGLPGSFQGASQSVLAEVAAQGIDVTGARLADCSGLAAGSAIPPGVLVDLLVLAADPARPELLPVVVDTAVAGWQGTLADRLTDGPASGLVRAKTGSLPGVTSLAGTLLTQDGRQLAFAVMADETPPGGQLGPRRVIDALVQQVAGCDCQLP